MVQVDLQACIGKLIQLPSKMIENCKVCKHKVQVITVWRIFFNAPLVWSQYSFVKQWMLGLAFVINRVETNNILEKAMQIRMSFGIICNLKERLENVFQNLLEVVYQILRFVNVTEIGYECFKLSNTVQ